MGKDIAHATTANVEYFRAHGPAAPHFRPDSRQTGLAGGRGRGARIAIIADDDGERGIKSANGRDIALVQFRVIGRLQHRARQDIERRAARMKIEKCIAARENFIGDEFRDLLGNRTFRIAGKCAVEIQPIDGRSPRARHHRMHVVRRHQDEATLNLAGIETTDQFANRDRALILVAMISAFENDSWTLAIADDADRDARHTPGIVMGRMGNHHKADLLAGLVEVYGGEGGASRGHVRARLRRE